MSWCKKQNLLYIAVLILVEATMLVNIEAMDAVVVKRASIFAQSDDDIKMLELCAVRNQQRLGSVFGNFTRHHKKGHKKRTTTPAPSSQNTSTTEEDIKIETTTTLPNNPLPRPQPLTSINNQNNNVNTNIDSIETDEEFDELIEKERHKKHKEKELLHEVVENKHSNKVKKMYRDATANVNKLIGKVKAGGGGTFLTDNCTTVLAQIGTTAVLHCEVSDITENTVTWIRRKDYSLLSVGLVTYSADNRFFSAHGRHVKDWALHIRFATSADAGFYECQVPTHPPTSIFFKLVLVAAYAEIMGESEKIIHEGSMLRLVCVVRRSTEPPSYVFWYFENRMINYDLNGVTVHNGRQTSELVIGKAQHRHAGNYTCVPANAKAASVTVHVVQSETPAAMQHGNKSSASCKNLELSKFVLFTLTLLLTYNYIALSTYSEYG